MPTTNELESLLTPIVDALTEVGPLLEEAQNEIIAALGGVTEIPVAALAKINQLGVLATAIKGASKGLADIIPGSPTPPVEPPVA